MAADSFVTTARVDWTPEVWSVPATLADFECDHGRIGACVDCDREAAVRLAGDLLDAAAAAGKEA